MRIFGVWRMAPWVRGPWLLLRRPGVVIALVAAAFVAGLPAAAAAPFLSASTNQTLYSQISTLCQYSSGLVQDDGLGGTVGQVYQKSIVTQAAVAEHRAAWSETVSAGEAALRASDTGHNLGPMISMISSESYLTAHGQAPTVVDLMYRTDAEQHVTVLDGPDGDGVWIPDTLAGEQHLAIGDTFSVAAPETTMTQTLRVAAIYRDLRSLPDEPYWCSMTGVYRGNQSSGNPPPVYDLVLVPEQVAVTQTTLQGQYSGSEFDIALRDPHMSIDRVPDAFRAITKVAQALNDNDEVPSQNGAHLAPRSYLNTFKARTDLARTGVESGVVPISGAGVLVGLLVVAAAGVFWVLRRRRELTMLSAHGMGAASLGLKAAIECTPALVVGSAGAWAFAWWLVRTAGPTRVIDRAALGQSLLAVAASLVASIVVVSIAASARARTLADQAPHRRFRFVGAIPWELVLVAGAVYLWRTTSGSTLLTGVAGGDAGAVVHVPPRLLLAPILGLAGVTTFLFRLLRLVLRKPKPPKPGAAGEARVVNGDGGVRYGGTARFLGWHRLVREGVVVAILGAATALPIGLAVYGATVTSSVQATVEGEALMHVGTDVVVQLTKPAPIPASLAGQATEVQRISRVEQNGVYTDLLAVDPDQFSKVAFWNTQINGRSLHDMLAPLNAPHRSGTPWPAVATKANAGVGELQGAFDSPPTFDVQVVDQLPAMQGGYGIMIVKKGSIDSSVTDLFTQIWIKGDPDDINRKLAAAHLPVAYETEASQLNAHTIFEPIAYTFEYLSALSLLTGMVTAVGLLLYLEARTPGHRRGYVMLRRMGMAARTHRRSLLLELAVPLFSGLAAGLALATGLARLLAPNFDVDSDVAPGTLLTMPGAVMASISVAILAVTLLATAFSQYRISHANPSEVLRDTI